MKRLDFVIFYESFNREYQNIYLLKRELESRGHSVKLSHFSQKDYYDTMKHCQPSVVVCPWLRYNENVFRYTSFRHPIKALVNLQWEQVYNNLSIREGLTRSTGEALKYIHLCWGENSQKRLVESGAPQENLPVVGGIHLDFCRKEFLDDLLPKEAVAEEFGFSAEKKLSLYISSFAYASYSPEEQKKFLEKYGNAFRPLFEVEEESKRLTLEWLREECLRDPDRIVVYRPHPAETVTEDLLSIEKEITNFLIISKYNIKQWIHVSDVINMWFSTSVAEIFYMGKKCNILRPVPLPDDLEVEVMNGAEFITSKEEFLRRTENCSEGGFPVSAERIGNYYSVEDKYSFKRIADVLEDLLLSDYVCPSPEFSSEEKREFRKKKRSWMSGAHYFRFYEKTGLALSRICPFGRRILKNLENSVKSFSRFDYDGAERSVDRVFEKVCKKVNEE